MGIFSWRAFFRRAFSPLSATPTTNFHYLYCSLCAVILSVVLVIIKLVSCVGTFKSL